MPSSEHPPAEADDPPFGADTGVVKGLLMGLDVPPAMSPTEWAQSNWVFSGDVSAEPGSYNPKRAPYQPGMLDSVIEPGVKMVTFKASSQVGKTSALCILIGYCADRLSGPMMLVQPTREVAEGFSKETLASAIRDVPIMAKIFPDPKSRDGDNTIFHKKFAGGFLALAGANSPIQLRRRAIRFGFADELDAWDGEATSEGDPLNLMKKRLTTFWDARLLVASTPLKKHKSRISRLYEESDQRKFMVPCPECGATQFLEWKTQKGTEEGFKPTNVHWTPGQPHTAHYSCEKCGALWNDAELKRAVRDGFWKAHAAFNGHAGFWIWELYSPWSSLEKIVREYEEAKGFPDRLETFVNTTLGLEWEGEVVGTLAVAELMNRREMPDMKRATELGVSPSQLVPELAGLLTADVDVQSNRLELQVTAWGLYDERWLLSHQVILGDPNGVAVWENLEELLLREYKHAHLAHDMWIEAVCLDSGGWHTQRVYDFCARNLLMGRRWYPIKGISGFGKPIWRRSTYQVRKSVNLILVGVDAGKVAVYKSLNVRLPGPNYTHLPMEWSESNGRKHGIDEAGLKSLTAETLVRTSDPKGFDKQEWHKPDGVANEVLDCFDAQTEVLTDQGWRLFSKLDRTEKLATVNLDSDLIEYQQPSVYIERDYVGEMVRFSSKRLDALVTPTHRMLAHRVLNEAWTPRAEFMLASDVKAYHGLKVRTRGWIGLADPMEVPAFKWFAPAASIDRGDLAELAGWYVAEGSRTQSVHHSQPGSIKTRVSISQKPGAKAAHIRALLDRLPWTWNFVSGKDFVCASRQLFDLLADCGRGCENKRVPQWVKDSSPAVIARFLDAMVLGDGWSDNAGHRTIATTSLQLANDLQELFLKAGSYSVLRTKAASSVRTAGEIRGRPIYMRRDQYHISEIRTARAFLYGPGRRSLVSRELYAGKVYCATVPNGTLIVRRNGRTLIAGNCGVYNVAARASIDIDMSARLAFLGKPITPALDGAAIARMFA